MAILHMHIDKEYPLPSFLLPVDRGGYLPAKHGLHSVSDKVHGSRGESRLYPEMMLDQGVEGAFP